MMTGNATLACLHASRVQVLRMDLSLGLAQNSSLKCQMVILIYLERATSQAGTSKTLTSFCPPNQQQHQAKYNSCTNGTAVLFLDTIMYLKSYISPMTARLLHPLKLSEGMQLASDGRRHRWLSYP